MTDEDEPTPLHEARDTDALVDGLRDIRAQARALIDEINSSTVVGLAPSLPEPVRGRVMGEDGVAWKPHREWSVYVPDVFVGGRAVFFGHSDTRDRDGYGLTGHLGDCACMTPEDARAVGLAFIAAAGWAETQGMERPTPV